jgi:hypothetical protein
MSLSKSVRVWQWLMLAAAAHAVAWLTTSSRTAYIVAFLVTLFGLLGGYVLLLRTLQRGVNRSLLPTTQWLDSIRRLPFEEARGRAERLLAGSAALKSHQVAEGDQDRPAAFGELGPETRSFFERYRRVETLTGIELDRALINRSAVDSDYITIGNTIGDGEVAVRPLRDEVYEIDGLPGYDPASEGFPSIYHWLIAACESEEADRRPGGATELP